MPNITYFDETTQNTYYFEVSEEEAKKANKDMLFATRLLKEKFNSNQTGIVSESETSTSSYVTDNEKVQESSDFEEKDTFRWPHEAILLLLSIYKEHEDNVTSGKMSVKKFWNMISCLLIKKGYNITGTQCKSKMAGLKNTYKSVKDHNAKSGNNTRTWRYFNIMDEMFNKKPWIAPISTLDSGKTISVSSDEDYDNENNENIIPPTKKSKLPIKRKRRTMLEQMLERKYNCTKKNARRSDDSTR